MIKKIIEIKDYGTFTNFNIGASDWDGNFKKVNIIYGGNGRGKTSLSYIFQSLFGYNNVLDKKKINPNKHSYIKLLDDGKKVIEYKDSRWNSFYEFGEVFNTLYIEDNTYVISYSNDAESANIFELLYESEALNLKKQIIDFKNQVEDCINKQKKLKRKIDFYNQNKDGETEKNKEKIKKLCSKIKLLKVECTNKNKLVEELEKKLFDLLNSSILRFINIANSYLDSFGTTLVVTDYKINTKKNSKNQKIIFGLKINGEEITLEKRLNNENSLKLILSEGDKNALALSFFLAKLDIIPDISKYIVVVDDPFTSFDSDRKRSTISKLSSLSNKVNQLFVLTHDMHFANDFTNSLSNNDYINLKIIPTEKNGNEIALHCIKDDMKIGWMKDISTIKNFIKNPEDDQCKMRDVIRCLRPSLEGLLRLKYEEHFSEKEWLGDFIGKIRESDKNSDLFRLKELVDLIDDVNNYSKQYHHSGSLVFENELSVKEVENYCKKTKKLILLI